MFLMIWCRDIVLPRLLGNESNDGNSLNERKRSHQKTRRTYNITLRLKVWVRMTEAKIEMSVVDEKLSALHKKNSSLKLRAMLSVALSGFVRKGRLPSYPHRPPPPRPRPTPPLIPSHSQILYERMSRPRNIIVGCAQLFSLISKNWKDHNLVVPSADNIRYWIKWCVYGYSRIQSSPLVDIKQSW